MNLMELFKLFNNICDYSTIASKFFELSNTILNIKKDKDILANEKITKYKEIIDYSEKYFSILKDIEKNSYIFNNKLSFYDISLSEKEYYGILYLLVCEDIIINELKLQNDACDNIEEILKKCKHEVLYKKINRISLMYNDNNFNPYYLENRDIYEEEFKQVEYVTTLLYNYIINNQNLYDPEIIKTIFMYKYIITADLNEDLVSFSINEYFFRRKPAEIFNLTIDDTKEIIDKRIFTSFDSLRIKVNPFPYAGNIFFSYFMHMQYNNDFNEQIISKFIEIMVNIFELNNNFNLLNNSDITKKFLINFINLRSYAFKKLYKILNRYNLWYYMNYILGNNNKGEWAMAMSKFLIKRRINKNLNVDFINEDILTDIITESLN